MTAALDRAIGAPVGRLALPFVLAGVSIAAGASILMIPPDFTTPSAGPLLAAGLIALVFVSWALISYGSRAVASLSLYGCALGLALPAARLTDWMTVSDLFLLAGGALLVPGLSNLRRWSRVQRGFGWAVTLILIGGLLGTIVAEEAQLSLLNVVRFAVAAGVTLVIFGMWAPSAVELRRFLTLVVLSGLVTGIWALTHVEANFGRPSGLSEHPNHLALVSLIAIGPAVAFSLVPGSRRGSQIAATGATAILVGAIVVSGSRSGLVGLVVAGVVAVLLVRTLGARARLTAVTATIVVGAIVGFSALTTENALSRALGPQTDSASQSDQTRRVLFGEMVDQIQQNPITGVGFADPLRGHDAYLQLWVGGGVLAFLGGLLVIGFAGMAAARARQLPLPSRTDDASWPLLASSISLSGLFAALVFQDVLWTRYVWITVALVAVSFAVSHAADRGPSKVSVR